MRRAIRPKLFTLNRSWPRTQITWELVQSIGERAWCGSSSAWHLINQSHLNQPDAQSNTMRMDPQTFNEIVSALQAAGLRNPVIH
jgi:hypothetical protein